VRIRIVIPCVCLILAVAGALRSQELAVTPPMGWNSWNHFAGKVTDADVRATVDVLVSSGMRDAGYVYVNVDDTWEGTRDEHGIIRSNERFPDMKALGNYIHSNGLKFGIYSSPGAKTCDGYEGSLNHEIQDAKTYASWGVDYLKYDLCSYADQMRKAAELHPDQPGLARKMMINAYRKMHDALKAAGRPVVYSLCQYGLDDVWQWGPQVGARMWRTTDDIDDSFGRMMTIAAGQSELSSYAGPGHWNDPDMLEIGNGKMMADEYKTHMSLWVLLAAPLTAGNDLSNMSDLTRSMPMNRDAIAIDQDRLGEQAKLLYKRGDLSVWTKKLTGDRLAIGLFNTSFQARDVSVDLNRVGFMNSAQLRDVWGSEDLGRRSGTFTAKVKSHGVVLLIAAN
jgi:alpha-galactosidase